MSATYPSDVLEILARKDAEIQVAVARRRERKKVVRKDPEKRARLPRHVLSRLQRAILRRLVDGGSQSREGLYGVMPERSVLTHKAAVTSLKKYLIFKGIRVVDSRDRKGGTLRVIDTDRARALL